MERRHFLRNLGLLSAVTSLPAVPLLANDKTGNTFTTVGVKGRVTAKGKGLANVVMSDGYSIAITDKNGNYTINTHHDAEYVFISLPSGYEIPNEHGLARFYTLINKKSASQTYNVELKAMENGDHKHAFVVWADPQIWDKADGNELVRTSAPDTREEIKNLGGVPTFGIGCGDLVFDKFDLFDDYNKAVEVTGVPFFQVIGNHDMDGKTARSDDQSQNKFKSLYGPTYYSFNRGKVHYIMLDDVFFLGSNKHYVGYLNEQQLAWIEKDLSTVPHGSMVIVSMHIPTNTGAARRKGAKEDSPGGTVANREYLYKMLKPYKVHIMSGHTHWNENWEKDNIMEHNHGTLCGAWWCGPCGDGAPAGYGVYEVDGDNITWYYKSVGKTKNHQIKIHAKGSIPEKPNAVVANVWNYDAKWKVEWFEDGVAKGEMTQYTGFDPETVALYKGDQLPAKHKWAEPIKTDHLYLAEPSANAKTVKVKATDRFGNIFEEVLSI
ncbi:calcineurin-like phosphoesterase family protein [Chitinophaga skermanii]|uniref:Calcineurin-like phosphoesterase family protein n=1 Tax=Chitinophaga skermanii TaxID=331697 RepID=A0A327QT72_9BACT|nr:calcineurin-like phosphoesterase family protein [Chitinophaga skermanii]RAJ06613.1 calcineurin-like phosphoesterase family protein [Chitinophaga skermanii]